MSENNESQQRGLARRMTTADKVKCALWVVLILLFAFWMGSFVPCLALPFVVDLYWTHFVRWDWWKSIKNKFLRNVMSWVDALVFALCAVWVLQNFFLQNFMIPTTSLEKTMLAGDYLLVSKYHYGPRVPMTPLSLPLFQHTIEIFGTRLGKSFIEKPQVPYRRMAGLKKVERNDIVVFNYPNGDTVCTKCENPDYYSLKQSKGEEYLRSHKAQFGEIVYRPVDRRENYVKRCIGLPGETLQIIDRKVFIDEKVIEDPRCMQHEYFVYARGEGQIDARFWHNLGIYTKGNAVTLSPDVRIMQDVSLYRALGIMPDSLTGNYRPLYLVNMTHEVVEKLQRSGRAEWIRSFPTEFEESDGLYAASIDNVWTPSNYGPIWIPKAGSSIELNAENELRYGRCIRTYEGNKLEAKADGTYLLNGKPATSYTFKMDYYWMMGDNRDNSLDSRFWGFVPEDHIVGTPLFIWMSKDQETGEWRSDRFFKSVKGF